jgi:hypothetical protein
MWGSGNVTSQEGLLSAYIKEYPLTETVGRISYNIKYIFCVFATLPSR